MGVVKGKKGRENIPGEHSTKKKGQKSRCEDMRGTVLVGNCPLTIGLQLSRSASGRRIPECENGNVQKNMFFFNIYSILETIVVCSSVLLPESQRVQFLICNI